MIANGFSLRPKNWVYIDCGNYASGPGILPDLILVQAPALGSGEAFWIGLSRSGWQGVIGFYLAFRGEKLLELCAASYGPGDEEESSTA